MKYCNEQKNWTQNLRWSFLRQPLTIFAKKLDLDVGQGSDDASEAATGGVL